MNVLILILLVIVIGTIAMRKAEVLQEVPETIQREDILVEPDRAVDLAAIRAFINDERYSATFVGTNAPTSFAVGKTITLDDDVERIDIPDEWKRTVHVYQSAQTVGTKCQVYHIEVYPDAQEVVEMHLEENPTGKANCEGSQSLGADGIFKPELSQTRIRELGTELFARVSQKIEGKDLTLKITPLKKADGTIERTEFLWEDTTYKVPEAFEALPKYPTIRFYLSSGGVLLSYVNSAPLFTAAYRSEELTLQGTYLCLPYSGTPEQHPPEGDCQYGLKTEKGTLYSLDFTVINPVLKLGDRFRAKGTFTPIETISNDFFRNRYTVRGIFSIKGPIEKK